MVRPAIRFRRPFPWGEREHRLCASPRPGILNSSILERLFDGFVSSPFTSSQILSLATGIGRIGILNDLDENKDTEYVEQRDWAHQRLATAQYFCFSVIFLSYTLHFIDTVNRNASTSGTSPTPYRSLHLHITIISYPATDSQLLFSAAHAI